ncbi:hypothetical protein LTR15_005899 [Elasticomyces elasticus]|nr:hypothetical protein LTR15_005899 [Elasticomyces elasticus]
MEIHLDDIQDTTWSAEALRVAASKLYTPIKDWQTRTIRVHPGANEDPLTADLLVAGLAHGDGLVIGMDQDLVNYEAVSYSWGEFKPYVPITINGQDYRLTESLAGALQRFRLESTERYLWADALCINQSDNYEKSAQVRNMFTIYHKAQRVLAWLGREGIGTADAITKATQSRNMKSGSHDIHAVENICFRPWARRVWVQQEVFAAKELVLFCGLSELNLDTYQKIAKYLFFQQKAPELLVNEPIGIATNAIMGLHTAGLRSVAAIEVARIPTQTRHPREGLWETCWEPTYGLANVLARCKAFEASNSRDYVFALLGLTNCVSGKFSATVMHGYERMRPLPFNIDYAMSISELLQQTTRYILNSDRSLSLLSEYGNPNLPPSDPYLPSWTIDWRKLKGIQRDAVHDGLLRLEGIMLGSVKSITVDLDHGEIHGGLVYCHVKWELSNPAHRGECPLTYTTHHQDGSKDSNPHSAVRSIHLPGHFAPGDIVVRVDGCVYNETLCLRPAPDGKYQYVCMITDGDDLRLMVNDGIHKGCDSCDGGFDELLVKRMVSNQAYPPLEREFVVC